jgi:hypothetical protein
MVWEEKEARKILMGSLARKRDPSSKLVST